jgi:hypothetical protein
MRLNTRVERAASTAAALVVVVLIASLDHCKGNCSIEASSYDQSCTLDSDCVAVFSGSFCGDHECACENSAINVSAQTRYVADLQNDHAPECPCPSPPAVSCNGGTCGLRTNSAVDAGAD